METRASGLRRKKIYFYGRRKQWWDCGYAPGRRKFDLSVYTAGPEESGVKDVNTVSGHDDLGQRSKSIVLLLTDCTTHLDILGRLESVKLVEELKHRPLHL